jgi:hypothetical protein
MHFVAADDIGLSADYIVDHVSRSEHACSDSCIMSHCGEALGLLSRANDNEVQTSQLRCLCGPICQPSYWTVTLAVSYGCLVKLEAGAVFHCC